MQAPVCAEHTLSEPQEVRAHGSATHAPATHFSSSSQRTPAQVFSHVPARQTWSSEHSAVAQASAAHATVDGSHSSPSGQPRPRQSFCTQRPLRLSHTRSEPQVTPSHGAAHMPARHAHLPSFGSSGAHAGSSPRIWVLATQVSSSHSSTMHRHSPLSCTSGRRSGSHTGMNSSAASQYGTHMHAMQRPSGHSELSTSSSIAPSQSSSSQLQRSSRGPTSPSHCSLPAMQRSVPSSQRPSSLPQASLPSASSTSPSQSSSSPLQVSSGESHSPHALRTPSSMMPSQSSSSPSHSVSSGSSHSSASSTSFGLSQNFGMPSSIKMSQSSSALLQISCGGCASAMIWLKASASEVSSAA